MAGSGQGGRPGGSPGTPGSGAPDYAPAMPARIPRPRRPRVRRTGAAAAPRPSLVVLGDLVVDVVLAPAGPLVPGSDVPGRVAFRQGGSAATTARWLARGGAAVALVGAVGRDGAGRALVELIRADGVTPRIVRVAGARTGRIGVLVGAGGERSFVQDRGAALRLAPADLRPAWFAGADLLHLPAYSVLEGSLGEAGRRAALLARAAGALVSLDLASVAPLLALGRRRALGIVAEVAPDLLLAAGGEARALAATDERLLGLAPAVVLKRGAKGATLLFRDGGRAARLEVATKAVATADTTGAGDAFDAGFLLAWLAARRAGAAPAGALRRGALAGHRLAARHLAAPRVELSIG